MLTADDSADDDIKNMEAVTALEATVTTAIR
jgi:hypothetical protein